ncbi:MAG: hypothetical protein ACREJC_14735 [Tepidisphaeraceae bacterium]
MTTLNRNMMTAPPAAVIDMLNELLDAELGSMFRFMGEGSPYLSRATAEVRSPLAEMVESGERRAGELFELIERLGGTPVARNVSREEQYLAFLSLRFLLPKLVQAKKLQIQRHENALRTLGNRSQPPAELLAAHLAEHKSQLAILERTAAQVATIR